MVVANYLALIVSQNPGEDWILHEVVVGATSQCVQLHQVLEVGHLSILNTGSERWSGGQRLAPSLYL